MERKKDYDMSAIVRTMIGHGNRFTPENMVKVEEYTRLLQKAIDRRAALTPEKRAAEDKARRDKIAQEEWDLAVAAGIFRARMAAEGFDL